MATVDKSPRIWQYTSGRVQALKQTRQEMLRSQTTASHASVVSSIETQMALNGKWVEMVSDKERSKCCTRSKEEGSATKMQNTLSLRRKMQPEVQHGGMTGVKKRIAVGGWVDTPETVCAHEARG